MVNPKSNLLLPGLNTTKHPRVILPDLNLPYIFSEPDPTQFNTCVESPGKDLAREEPNHEEQTVEKPSTVELMPSGWCVGASFRHNKKYYFDPVSKDLFWSRKAVLTHLGLVKTGRKKKQRCSDPDYNPRARKSNFHMVYFTRHHQIVERMHPFRVQEFRLDSCIQMIPKNHKIT